jgi:hypothetical protein
MLATLRCYAWVCLAAAAWALAPSPSRAGMITYTVTFPDTTSLENQPGRGPYYLDFQFNDGSGAGGDGNNTVIISRLSLGGGALVGTGVPSGGTTGDLSFAVTITDSTFFNDFNQQFTPGSSLSFQVSLTQIVGPGEDPSAGGVPDEFTFAIQYTDPLTGQTDIPTTNFNAAFATIDVTSPALTVTPSGSDVSSGFDVPAPGVTPSATAVPEPTSLSLALLGLAVLGVRRFVSQRSTI